MPRAIIAIGEHYHVFNRAINKQTIFLDKIDYSRIISLLFLAQSSEPLYNIGRRAQIFLRKRELGLSKSGIDDILYNRIVELVCFVVMPNHFHVLIKEIVEGGISLYLQKIEIAYTKYFNNKYHKSGYLFQGPYQSVHIENNEQLLHLSAYIHKNIGEFKKWKDKEYSYRWSSYQYYLGKNGWQGLLVPGIILGQFKTPEEYKNFVETSGVKEFDPDLLI